MDTNVYLISDIDRLMFSPIQHYYYPGIKHLYIGSFCYHRRVSVFTITLKSYILKSVIILTQKEM
jgi:hypothetical protein